jgi:hypothetical protein
MLRELLAGVGLGCFVQRLHGGSGNANRGPVSYQAQAASDPSLVTAEADSVQDVFQSATAERKIRQCVVEVSKC